MSANGPRARRGTAAVPTNETEVSLVRQGYARVAGVDEAGRGPLAGPVVAGAVVLPRRVSLGDLPPVRDSKTLSARQRDAAYAHIRRIAHAWAVGEATSREIDDLGIGPAVRLAMVRAVRALSVSPDYLLVDALRLPTLDIPQQAIVHGDRLCLSIAAASILAKVTRDRLMTEADQQHPGYGFARHKGYGTREHLERLRSLGPSPIHRRSFAPVRRFTVDGNSPGADKDPGTGGMEPRADYTGPQASGPAPPESGAPTSEEQDRDLVAKPASRAETGARGEDQAAAYLEETGWAIVARNYRCRLGEMDIVALEGGTLVFVEVRTRRGESMGSPEESVTAAKQARLIAIARWYMQEHPHPSGDWRIDVIAIDAGYGEGAPSLRHLRHAFGAP